MTSTDIQASAAAERPACSVAVCIQTRIYRDGLTNALKAHGGFGVARACESPDELRLHLRQSTPHVTLIDLCSQRALKSSSAEVRKTYEVARGCPIVVLGFNDDDTIVGLLESGAAAYVTINDSIDDLVGILRDAAQGEFCCKPRIARRLQQRLAQIAGVREGESKVDRLSRRELEVLALVQAGRSNKQIARELCLEVPTIKNHMHHIIAKLDVRSRHEAGALLRTAAAEGPPVTA